MYVRNCWYVAAWDYEIPEGKLFSIRIIDKAVLIFRKQDGDLVALADRCCHRFAPLSLGRVEDGCNIRCMYHGLKFAPDGRCIEIPGQDVIPATAKVRVFPVVEKHSWVWIWMGDAAAADESLIPNAVGFDDPTYNLRSGSIDYDANYQLINDNLTDFSHLSYVHANSFRATPAWASIRPSVRRIDRGVRVSRWLPQELAATETLPGQQATSVEAALWQTYDYLVPGVLLMYSALYPASAMPEDRVTPPEGEPLSANFTSQAVTPLGDQKTRYFFSWGPRRIDGGDELADMMFGIANMAFTEDRIMIEAQQRTINEEPGQEVLTSADTGPVQMRAVIRRLVKQETSGDKEALDVFEHAAE